MLKTLSILIAFGLSAIATTAQAQSDWPQKPVRIIVPTAPGGSIDLLARLVAANLQQK